jgi:hypothetical protein
MRFVSILFLCVLAVVKGDGGGDNCLKRYNAFDLFCVAKMHKLKTRNGSRIYEEKCLSPLMGIGVSFDLARDFCAAADVGEDIQNLVQEVEKYYYPVSNCLTEFTEKFGEDCQNNKMPLHLVLIFTGIIVLWITIWECEYA